MYLHLVYKSKWNRVQSTAIGYCLLSLVIFGILYLTEYATSATIDTYMHACDGSAAVSIGPSLFITASDEDNILRVYKYAQTNPIREYDLNFFLQLGRKQNEVDIEGAGVIGSRIYWIGSHGRDKDGNKQPDRARLFATEIVVHGEDIEISPVGVPYKRLKDDLSDSELLKKFRFEEARKLAPQLRDALNIEGLAATSGGELLIGFRNPLYENNAIIIPVTNPGEIISGKPVTFGLPILLSLDGLGIRSIEYVPAEGRYLIIAGASQDDQPKFRFKLYEWKGPGSTEVRLITELRLNGAKVQPESIHIQADKNTHYVLSDDGGFTNNPKGIRCKKLPVAERSFRGFVLP